MGIQTLFTLLAVPPGYPEQIEVPPTFLHQIDTTFWIWGIRIVLIGGLLVCMLYAHSSQPNKDSEEKDHDQLAQEGEGAMNKEDKEKL